MVTNRSFFLMVFTSTRWATKNSLHRIQQAIYYFVKNKGFVHPPVGEWGPWLLLPEYVF
jgi:hypothetical protein